MKDKKRQDHEQRSHGAADRNGNGALEAKEAKENKTIKQEDVFLRWGTELRQEPETVLHAVYETQTVVTPEQFALYETAIKANYANWFADTARRGQYWDLMGLMHHFQNMADRNYIALPFITDEQCQSQDFIDQAAQDYHFCAKQLREAGLYYALLD